MSKTERVMLYAVALVVGGMLVLDRGATGTKSATAPTTQQILPARQPNIDRPRPDGASPASANPLPRTAVPVTAATEKSPGALSPQHNAMEPIIIQDDAGHPRIELLVNEDGQAQLVLRSSDGEPGVILAVDANGDSMATILRGDRSGKILATRQGDLSLTLTSRQSGFEATVSDDGGSRLLLTGLDQAQTAISVGPNGDAEIRVTGSRSTAEAIMRVLNDGLGQVTLRGKDAEDGPNMMRLADGVAILSTQLPGGKPGGSMVTSPDGASVIAVQSMDGKNSASLRMNSAGQAKISATEPGK